jgi:opacity protein-like surface antigen
MRVLHIGMIVLIALVSPGKLCASGFEITPILGYTLAGSFEDSVTGIKLEVDDSMSYGIILDINQKSDTQIELYYSLQPTQLKKDEGTFIGYPLFDLNIHYIHLGGTVGMGNGKVNPYIVGTFGATYLDPKQEGLDSETKLSLSLGGGVKLFATDRVGVRIEGRGFGTYFGGSDSVFCSSGNCLISLNGDVFLQFTANVGLTIAF